MALVTTMPISMSSPIIAGRPRERSVDQEGDQSANDRQRQARHDNEGVPERPQRRDHHEIDQNNAYGHGEEDRLEALRYLLEDAAVDDFNSSGQVQRVNLRLYLGSYGLSVIGSDAPRNARRTEAVRPCDGDRPRVASVSRLSDPVSLSQADRISPVRPGSPAPGCRSSPC